MSMLVKEKSSIIIIVLSLSLTIAIIISLQCFFYLESQPTIKEFVIPQEVGLKSNYQVWDFFARDSINPENAIPYYTIETVGNGFAKTEIGEVRNYLRIETGYKKGDSTDVRLSELYFEKFKRALGEKRNKIEIGVIFAPVTFKKTEGFIGLILGTDTHLTSIPNNTIPHIGLYWDRSKSDNFILSNSDGITKNETETEVPVVNEDQSISIVWWGGEVIYENIYQLQTQSEVIIKISDDKNRHITQMKAPDTGVLHFFVATEEDKPKHIRVLYWKGLLL
jgi:hypothetical protein